MPLVSAESDLDQEPAPPAATVRRWAVYLESRREPLFGWLHRPADRLVLDHGVLICPPLGHEQLHAHRAMRHLADRLAGCGAPVLRFDWHGTGDSAGTDEDPERCQAWLDNARDAARWLRDKLGCTRVSAIGVRLGALVAAEAFEHAEIDHLVLWAPPITGKSYIRQMKVIDRSGDAALRSAAGNSDTIEAAGFVLTPETIAGLGRWSLLDTRPRCRRLLLASDYASGEDRLRAWGERLPLPVDVCTLSGTPEMLLEPHRGRVPDAAIDSIGRWLAAHALADAVPALAVEPASLGLPQITLPGPPVAGGSRGRVYERPLNIGEHGLFGVLTEPERADELLPAVVLLNAGSAYRIAPGRIYVTLARRLAAIGFRTLRLDIAGLGDSVAADCHHENDPYPATAFRDFQSAIEQLKFELDVRRVVLAGLCSGAYAAFQAAVQLPDPTLVESVLINPLTFFWKDGMSLDAPSIEQVLQQHRYLARAWEPRKLLKFITGRTRIGFGQAARIVARRLLRQVGTAESASDQFEPARTSSIGHPLEDNLPADLARVAAHGRNLAMFFATTDPGYSLLTYHARRQVNRLRQIGRLQTTFINAADHTFSRRCRRQELIEQICAHLRERYVR